MGTTNIMEDKQLEILRQRAESGDAVAMCEIGDRCYDSGHYEECVKWYRAAAKQGDASAQYSLGYCCQYGIGVEQDEEEAIEWYWLSAKQGNADAQNNLGYCYQHGIGVKQDYGLAVKLVRASAKQGNAPAQYNLGYCYQYGIGVEQDEDVAIEWYRAAAEQGYTLPAELQAKLDN